MPILPQNALNLPPYPPDHPDFNKWREVDRWAKQLPLNMLRGSVSFSVTAANSASGTVTFPKTTLFATAPHIQLTVQIGSNLDFLANLTAAPTTTQFTWRVFQKDGTNVTGSGVLYWLAYPSDVRF